MRKRVLFLPGIAAPIVLRIITTIKFNLQFFIQYRGIDQSDTNIIMDIIACEYDFSADISQRPL